MSFNLVMNCFLSYRYQRFSSFDQQDSEEVLRCLLDGIRTEEINVCTVCVLYMFESVGLR